MPVSKQTRKKVGQGLGSMGMATQLCNIIDAGSGTVGAELRSRLIYCMANARAATTFITKVQTSAALSGIERRHLMNMCGDVAAAKDIARELAL